MPALTPVFWNLVIIAGLVLGVPARRRDRRGALRLRGLDPGRDARPGAAAAPLAARPRRSAAPRARLARPGGAPRLRPDAPGDDRPRAHQLQHARRTRSSPRASSTRSSRRRAIDKAFRIYMLPQGMFSVAVATVLFPRAVAARRARRLRRVPPHGRARASPDRASRSFRRASSRAVLADADHPPRLRARRVRGPTRRRHRGRARRLLARPRSSTVRC